MEWSKRDIAAEQQYWLELGFDVRSSNAFINHDIHTLEQVASHSEKWLLRMPNYGRKSLNITKEILAAKGLRLASDPGDAPDILLARLYAKLAGHMEQVAAIKAQIARIESET